MLLHLPQAHFRRNSGGSMLRTALDENTRRASELSEELKRAKLELGLSAGGRSFTSTGSFCTGPRFAAEELRLSEHLLGDILPRRSEQPSAVSDYNIHASSKDSFTIPKPQHHDVGVQCDYPKNGILVVEPKSRFSPYDMPEPSLPPPMPVLVDSACSPLPERHFAGKPSVSGCSLSAKKQLSPALSVVSATPKSVSSSSMSMRGRDDRSSGASAATPLASEGELQHPQPVSARGIFIDDGLVESSTSSWDSATEEGHDHHRHLSTSGPVSRPSVAASTPASSSTRNAVVSPLPLPLSTPRAASPPLPCELKTPGGMFQESVVVESSSILNMADKDHLLAEAKVMPIYSQSSSIDLGRDAIRQLVGEDESMSEDTYRSRFSPRVEVASRQLVSFEGSMACVKNCHTADECVGAAAAVEEEESWFKYHESRNMEPASRMSEAEAIVETQVCDNEEVPEAIMEGESSCLSPLPMHEEPTTMSPRIEEPVSPSPAASFASSNKSKSSDVQSQVEEASRMSPVRASKSGSSAEDHVSESESETGRLESLPFAKDESHASPYSSSVQEELGPEEESWFNDKSVGQVQHDEVPMESQHDLSSPKVADQQESWFKDESVVIPDESSLKVQVNDHSAPQPATEEFVEEEQSWFQYDQSRQSDMTMELQVSMGRNEPIEVEENVQQIQDSEDASAIIDEKVAQREKLANQLADEIFSSLLHEAKIEQKIPSLLSHQDSSDEKDSEDEMIKADSEEKNEETSDAQVVEKTLVEVVTEDKIEEPVEVDEIIACPWRLLTNGQSAKHIIMSLQEILDVEDADLVNPLEQVEDLAEKVFDDLQDSFVIPPPGGSLANVSGDDWAPSVKCFILAVLDLVNEYIEIAITEHKRLSNPCKSSFELNCRPCLRHAYPFKRKGVLHTVGIENVKNVSWQEMRDTVAATVEKQFIPAIVNMKTTAKPDTVNEIINSPPQVEELVQTEADKEDIEWIDMHHHEEEIRNEIFENIMDGLLEEVAIHIASVEAKSAARR